MAARFIRFFSTPEDMTSGTVMAMSSLAEGVIDSIDVQHYLLLNDIGVEELGDDQYVCRDDDGLRIAYREVVLRPPLSDQQIAQLGHIGVESVDGYRKNAFAVDCRVSGDIYGDIIAAS